MIKLFDILVTNNNNNFDILKYKKINTRKVCYRSNKDTCYTDIHCNYDNKKCKLYISATNLVDEQDNNTKYTILIMEELLRNRLKRDEILNNKISDVLNKDIIEPFNNEIIFSDNKSKEDLDKLFKPKDYPYFDNNKAIDIIKESNFNFNPKNYTIKNIKISNYWDTIFKETDINVNIIENQSLFKCIRKKY